MSKKKKPAMPVIPRDNDVATFSEMVPFRSTKIKLAKSPLMIFAIFTALVTPFMFGLMMSIVDSNDPAQRSGAFMLQATTTVLYLLVTFLVGVFAYARPGKPIWRYFGVFAAVVVIGITPLFNILAFPFRGIIPGIVETGLSQTSVISSFIGMFFIAGLAEEFIKAVPVLLAAWIAWNASGKSKGKMSSWALEGPLDAVVMGIFAGAGFIFFETAFEYVPNQAADIAKQTGDQNLGFVGGMSLLLPRVFGGITGHMGYSAIACYFIGLAVIRPAQKWKLIAIGWVGAALVHATWNSFGSFYSILQYPIQIATVVAAVGCLLKARQLAMVDGEARPETFGSIIVQKEKPPAKPKPASLATQTPLHSSPPSRPPHATATIEQVLTLNINGISFPLRAGEAIDLADEPALESQGRGIAGMVVAHPSRANVLGLRNSGAMAWTARLRDGSQQMIEPGQNIRLAANVQIEFGNGLHGLVAPVA